MTDESRQEVIKLIYCDDFFSKPENRHLRDKFIKQNILETRSAKSLISKLAVYFS